MTPAERMARKRRMEAAGFKALPHGWVPASYADKVAFQVEAHREDAERAATQDLPRGRPKGKGK